MDVLIRRSTGSDAEAVAQLYLRARRAGAIGGTIPPLAHDDDEVISWVARVVVASLECWLATRAAGGLVGMLVLEGDWIDQLYVEPSLTRSGIGAQLIAVAKRQRPDGLRLWTFTSNDGAQRFYLRHGFREVERTDGHGNEEGAPDIQYAWLPEAAGAASHVE